MIDPTEIDLNRNYAQQEADEHKADWMRDPDNLRDRSLFISVYLLENRPEILIWVAAQLKREWAAGRMNCLSLQETKRQLDCGDWITRIDEGEVEMEPVVAMSLTTDAATIEQWSEDMRCAFFVMSDFIIDNAELMGMEDAYNEKGNNNGY